MNLLPSEQKERIDEAIRTFEETGTLSIFEPCDCGDQIRHNNGGNYHEIVYLRRDGNRTYVKYETTCELVAPAEWRGRQDWQSVIRQNSDWL